MRRYKGTKDNIFSIEIDGEQKKRSLSSQKMDSVIRKKKKKIFKITRTQAQIGKRTILLEGDTKDFRCYIWDSSCSMCLKVWDRLTSRCCIRLEANLVPNLADMTDAWTCWRRTELDVVGAVGYGGTSVVDVQVVCEGPRPAAINTELQLIIVDEVVGSRKEVIGSNVAHIVNRITRFKGVAGSQRPFNFDSVVWCFDNLVRFIAGWCFWGRSVEEPVSITHPILARCFRPSNAFGVGDRILIQICHSVSSTHSFWSLLRIWVWCLPRDL